MNPRKVGITTVRSDGGTREQRRVEPVPETKRALEHLSRTDSDLRQRLGGMADRVRDVVPECVGMSVAILDEALTFTLVATGEEIASLDALQYLGGGPCVDAVETGVAGAWRRADLLDEHQWQLFALGEAAAGVRSTLSLPITDGRRVVVGLNLYAATDDAFEGHHDELAAALGAWAPGVVTNADLSFRTRAEATQAPGRIEDRDDVDRAIGVLAGRSGIDTNTAERRLREAAERAGVEVAAVARLILESGSH
jgi:GAF domain-containing protein